MRSGDGGVICARLGQLLWSGVRMTALHKASVGVRIEERVEERDTTWRRTVEKEWNIAGWTSKNMGKE